MTLHKKIAVLLLIFSLLFLSVSFVCAEEFEETYVEVLTGDFEEEEEEKEYIVYFNDSVATLYAEEGDEYAILSEDELNECLDEGVVEFYEENATVYLYGDYSDYDPLQNTYKWDVNLINADYALDLGYTGDGVKVAVIDSGCKTTGDLSDNILDGYNVVDNNTDVTDAEGHGTMVTGQIVAEMNSVGFRGVAPGAKVVPLKAFSGGSSKVSIIVDAIYMAVDEYECDIINMSLGTSSDSETLKAAIDYAAGKNVIMVAAMGNKGTDAYSYPAAYDNVIAVGAVDGSKNICSYSQYNDAITVVAPGGKSDGKLIYSLSPSGNGNFLKSHGTSFAAPLVTGIAAIFRDIDPDFSHEEFLEVIENASLDLGNSGYDVYYGYGFADVEKYLKYYLAPMGDNNADGAVTETDAMNILDYVLGIKTGFVKEEMADVNEDGVINVLDAILVARCAAGWEGYDLSFGE